MRVRRCGRPAIKVAKRARSCLLQSDGYARATLDPRFELWWFFFLSK